jgi:hypothetical protein
MKDNLPNFLVVGSTKAGTTSLYNYLLQHPQIYLHEAVKETNFFVEPKSILGCGPRFCGERSYGTSLPKYEKLFEDADPLTHKAIGEICTTYLHFSSYCIDNIRKYLDDPKIVIILRNPVERAYSFYMHNVRDGDENLSFEEALTAEDERKKQNLWLSFRLKELGNYYDDVKNYIDNFSNVKILFYEDMKADMETFLTQLYDFLNVDKIQIDTKQKHNISGIPKFKWIHDFIHGNTKIGRKFLRTLRKLIGRKKLRDFQSIIDSYNLKKMKISPKVKKELEKYYKDDIAKLSSLLEVDLFKKWNIQKETDA